MNLFMVHRSKRKRAPSTRYSTHKLHECAVSVRYAAAIGSLLNPGLRDTTSTGNHATAVHVPRQPYVRVHKSPRKRDPISRTQLPSPHSVFT
jgi:hypothetical protein